MQPILTRKFYFLQKRKSYSISIINIKPRLGVPCNFQVMKIELLRQASSVWLEARL
jgi:hypothetical protein